MRIALGIEYDGTGYYGWQYQENLPTIQGALETALGKIADSPVFLHCAGRTDANVHATGQVVHFDTDAKRHIDAWIWGANAHLPKSIAVRWAKAVDYHFHARFRAKSRKYRYVIYNHPIRPAVLMNRVSWHYYPLNIEAMQAGANFLLGEQDFSSFRSSQCGSKTPMRHVMAVQIARHGDLILFDIKANAFLHHMVRNIVGVLLKIGSGEKPAEWAQEVLLAKNRRAAGTTAPAEGLYLTQVQYKEPYIFPASNSFFLL